MNFMEYKEKLRSLRKQADTNQCPECGLPVESWRMNCPNCGASSLGRSWPLVDHPMEPPMQLPQAPDTIPLDLERDLERSSPYGPERSLPSNPDNSSSGLTVPEHFQNLQRGDALPPQAFTQFMEGYFEAALWSSSIGEDFAADHNERTGEDWAPDQSLQSFGFEVDDIDKASAFEATQECRNFCNDNSADLEAYASKRGWDYAGHDFWLTRNGHGVGFWDRGLGELGDRLTDASKVYGESYMYPGNDGKVYIQ